MLGFSSPYFLVQITQVLGGGQYAFKELWLVPGQWTVKDGGRLGDSSNPGNALPGVQFSVGDYALCRSGDGMAGTQFELSAIPQQSFGGTSGSGSPPCTGYGWVSALTTNDCLSARIASASGACSCSGSGSGSSTSSVLLTPLTAGTWVSGSQMLEICGVEYMLQFQQTQDCDGPCLKLITASSSGSGGATSYAGLRECGGCNYAVFAFGDPAICAGTPDTSAGPCGNVLRIEVSWMPSCNPLDVVTACIPSWDTSCTLPFPEILCVTFPGTEFSDGIARSYPFTYNGVNWTAVNLPISVAAGLPTSNWSFRCGDAGEDICAGNWIIRGCANDVLGNPTDLCSGRSCTLISGTCSDPENFSISFTSGITVKTWTPGNCLPGCTPITGWGGAGWYCVVDTGGDCTAPIVVELTAGDECDSSIVLCSGPYDTESAAITACGGGGLDISSCCSGHPTSTGGTVTGGCSGGSPWIGGTVSVHGSRFQSPASAGYYNWLMCSPGVNWTAGYVTPGGTITGTFVSANCNDAGHVVVVFTFSGVPGCFGSTLTLTYTLS